MGAIAAELASILTPSQIATGDALSPDWRRQVSLAYVGEPTIPVVVFPDTEAELAAVVVAGHAQGWRMLPCGAGTKLGWGGLMPELDVVISTAHLNQVIAHWVEDFTVRVQAGVRLKDLQAQLRSHNQFLPIDPMYEDTATLGGIVATADTGSLRQRYGGIRDLLIGVQMVRDDGAVAKAGGRVVKNVAGYDLMKLMTGSYGTLAVLSELTFKLYPVPERTQTVQVLGSPDAIARAALQIRLAGITPVAMDWVGGPLLGEALSLVGRFEGLPEGVDEQIGRLRALATAAGAKVEPIETAIWQQGRQALAQAEVVAKVGMKPTAISSFFEQAAQVFDGDWGIRIHNAGGLGLLGISGNQNVSERLLTMRSHCQSAGGFLSLLAGPKSIKAQMDVWGYSGNGLGIMRQLKVNFDPQSLLSTGRFVGDI
ncbi:MAG: FAD-binding oxidoreductase [Cyanobacteria bacterium J06628_6]